MTSAVTAQDLPVVPHWIGGKKVSARESAAGRVVNPATGRDVATVSFASAADVNQAVAAAVAAAGAWGELSLARRSAVLFELRNLLRRDAEKLARIITAEHGKVLADARAEVARGIENVEYATGIPELLKGEFSEQVASGVDVHSVRQPLGVAVGVTPFNFPLMVPLWMASNAIACGNAFILKPSEKVPSAAVVLAELWQEAGLPDGVLTVLQGDRSTVEALLAHSDVDALSFVGSTPVARAVYQAGTAAGKRVQALGGAKNHLVVLPDADLDAAADAAVSAGYGAAGERCMAVSVVVAVGDAADGLVEKISERISKLTIGPGDRDGVDMGPLISAEHRDRVSGYISAGQADGAEVVVDGRGHAADQGFFLGATLFDRVQPTMTIYTDEIFGPVLGVVRVATLADAIALVNSHQFANGAVIFTRDGGAAREFQRRAQSGMVGVNVPIPVPVAYYSFGGWRGSLFGDTHIYGPDGVRFYTRGKVITTRWPDPADSRVDLGFPQNL